MCRGGGGGKKVGCKPRNRARVLDKPVTDTSIPFRNDNLIERKGGGKERGEFPRPGRDVR